MVIIIIYSINQIQNFFVQQTNPKQAGEIFENIIRQKYLISKHTNITYNDSSDMTPTERNLIFRFIKEDLEEKKKIQEQHQAAAMSK